MRRRIPIAATIALCLAATTARGHRLEARWTDEASLRFGATLAGAHTRIAVASQTTADQPGVVAVYERDGTPLLRHATSDGDAGRALLLLPDALLVGAPGATTAGAGTGAVLRVPLAGDAADGRLENPAAAPGGFGAALARVGDELAVGAPGLAGEAGAVHLYSPDAAAPRLTLTAPGAPPPVDDLFGATLAARGGDLVVGAPGDDHGGRDAGRVYVFDAATGALRFTIPPPVSGFGVAFGTALAVLPDAIAVGGPGAPNGPLGGAGGVWLFDATDGALRARVTDPWPLERGRFGTSLAAAGDFLAIGAPGGVFAPPTAGMVHVHRVDGAHVQTLIHPERTAAMGGFGTTLAGLDDGTIAAASPGVGAVYRFGTACPLCGPCEHCDPTAGACVPDAVCRPAAWLLGDSITSGCGSHVAAARPNWTIVNHGRPLDVAAQGLERADLLLAQAESLPHVAHVFLGTNDITFARLLGRDPDVVSQNVAAVMADIRARFAAFGVPTAIGLPLGLPRDLREREPDPAVRQALADGVRALRHRLQPLRPTVSLTLRNPRLYDDLVHPSALGCDVLSRRILGGLGRLLRSRGGGAVRRVPSAP
jgi:lysophospholipase L1-like esterase/outer membrane protein assembly factor BamB